MAYGYVAGLTFLRGRRTKCEACNHQLWAREYILKLPGGTMSIGRDCLEQKYPGAWKRWGARWEEGTPDPMADAY